MTPGDSKGGEGDILRELKPGPRTTFRIFDRILGILKVEGQQLTAMKYLSELHQIKTINLTESS